MKLRTHVIALPLTLIAMSVNVALAQNLNENSATDTSNTSEKTNNGTDSVEIPKLTIDETFVITATRYQQDVDKIPGAITVIKEEDIARQLSVSDDLTAMLSTLVPSMTPSRQKLSNQGENLRGRTALILVDGVPQNNPLRNGNRYGHPVDSSVLERVEVVNGASAVHGMGATGGMINYITKTAKEGDDFNQTVGVRMTDNFKDDGMGSKAYYSLKHHDEKFDIVAAASWDDRGINYDGNGNAVGMNSVQGETQDSQAGNFFVKAGKNFGDQRLEFSVNQYHLEGKNNYVPIKGDFEKGIVGTIEKGTPSGEPVSNKTKSYNLKYTHDDLANGGLTVQAFYQEFDAVFGEANWFPTPEIAKDQGVIKSKKQGVKVAYSKIDIFDKDDSWVFGIDVLDDTTQQSLVNTGLGVTPKMRYLGVSPFVQGDF